MKLGIIGGSGLYDIPELRETEDLEVDTPFGAPSDVIRRGTVGSSEVYFLPRHGRGHRFLPSEINHRANILAFKQLGIDCLISFSAVGSLREELPPRDIVLPDQYYDRTKQNHTFFGDGIAAHIPFGDPACPALHAFLAGQTPPVLAGTAAAAQVHVGGTYVNMEGPAFSTRAESESYRRAGFDIIGMTSLPEAKLSREAGICYASVALVTDYDCWHASEDVNVEMVIQNVQANSAFAKRLLVQIATHPPRDRTCGCRDALKGAVMTAPDQIPPEARERLRSILP